MLMSSTYESAGSATIQPVTPDPSVAGSRGQQHRRPGQTGQGAGRVRGLSSPEGDETERVHKVKSYEDEVWSHGSFDTVLGHNQPGHTRILLPRRGLGHKGTHGCRSQRDTRE